MLRCAIANRFMNFYHLFFRFSPVSEEMLQIIR